MFGVSINELLIVFLILLLLFGSSKLPALARSLGTSINEFKESVKPEAAKKDSPEQKPEEAAK